MSLFHFFCLLFLLFSVESFPLLETKLGKVVALGSAGLIVNMVNHCDWSENGCDGTKASIKDPLHGTK